MEIKITKEEYRTLLDILDVADWVFHGYKTEEDPETIKYKKLEQKIFACAKDIGFENLIKFDKKFKEYFRTKEYEETSPCDKFITEFEKDCFWDELTERLVRRDLIRQEGKEKLSKMSIKEIFQKEDPFREKYNKEFETYGLDRIRI